MTAVILKMKAFGLLQPLLQVAAGEAAENELLDYLIASRELHYLAEITPFAKELEKDWFATDGTVFGRNVIRRFNCR